jgi:type II secretory pathway pseudopilin PulG
MKHQAGFTLVEVVVTSFLGMFLAGVILTVFLANTNQIDEGTAMLKMSQQYEVVSEQIKKVSKRAVTVKGPGDPATLITGPFTDPLSANLSQVIFCGPAGDIIGGFQIRTDGESVVLDEWDASIGAFKPFTVGNGETILLKDMVSSYFQILPQRKGIYFNLTLARYSQENEDYFLRTKQETVLCRNASL